MPFDEGEGRDEVPLRPGNSSADSSKAVAKDAPTEWHGGEAKETPGRAVSDASSNAGFASEMSFDEGDI